MSKPENGPQIPAIRWPVPKNNRGGDFINLEEMLAHLEGEATGHWLKEQLSNDINRSGYSTKNRT